MTAHYPKATEGRPMHVLIAAGRGQFTPDVVQTARKLGYAVTQALSFAEARLVLENAKQPVDIAVFARRVGNAGPLAEEGFMASAGACPHRPYCLLIAGETDMPFARDALAGQELDDCLRAPFDENDIRTRLRMAERVVRAERSQRLTQEDVEAGIRLRVESARRTQTEIVARLFNATESSAEESDGHVRSVGCICAYMAGKLGWDQERIDTLNVAATLHDVGKMGIPDMVLRKPGGLNKAEYALVMQHCAIGARILAGSRDPVVRMAERIAMYHHENWDGSGYPEGLAGEAIPIEARMAAIADVFDTLTRDRVYRSAFSDAEAAAIVGEYSGTKFDPALCALFLEHLDDMKRYCAGEAKRLPHATFTETE